MDFAHHNWSFPIITSVLVQSTLELAEFNGRGKSRKSTRIKVNGKICKLQRHFSTGSLVDLSLLLSRPFGNKFKCTKLPVTFETREKHVGCLKVTELTIFLRIQENSRCFVSNTSS